MAAIRCLCVTLFAGAMLLLTGQASAVNITDFGSNTSSFGGDWLWNSSTKTLDTGFVNGTTDYLFQTAGFVPVDITGGTTASITGSLLVGSGTGGFNLQLTNSGTIIATSQFLYSQFSAGPQTVTAPLTFTGAPIAPLINQWYIRGNGDPPSVNALISFTSMTVAVPEPSTYAMALAGLGFTGYSMRRCRKRA